MIHSDIGNIVKVGENFHPIIAEIKSKRKVKTQFGWFFHLDDLIYSGVEDGKIIYIPKNERI